MSYYAAANPVNAIDPDGLCALRMVGGIADIGAGLLLTAKTGGIGLVVAWGLIINGADNLVAGAYSMIAGEEIPSLIQSGFRRAIPNRTAADLAYLGFEISLNVAGLAIERAAMRATQAGGSGVGTASGIADDLATQGSGSTISRMPSYQYGNVSGFGQTDRFGNITIQQGLSGSDFFETLYHEGVHRFLSPKSGHFMGLRANIRMVAYQKSHLLRYLEEAIAETVGTGSLIRGLNFPFHPGYQISKTRLILETAGYLGVTVGGIYAGYHLSQ